MRLLVEIFLIGALLYFGWEKPFRDRLPASQKPEVRSQTSAAAPYQPFVRSTSTPATVLVPVATPQPAASRSGSWMFDPNHRSALDPPPRTATPH